MTEAIWGFVGSVIGAVATVVGFLVQDAIAEHRVRRRDAPRRKIIRQMLEDPAYEWRDLETISRVIGTDRSEAARLLIAEGARGSEEGNDVWALLSRKPLP